MFYSASMRFAFSDEQEELRRSVRRVVDGHGGIAAARGVLTSELGHDGALWSKLSRDLGLAGLLVPEAHGGVGLGWVEVAAVMEELGRTLAPVPFFSTVCLGTGALLACGAPHAGSHVGAIAAGERTATLAHDADVHVEGDRLHGTARLVVDGDTADLIVVAARDGLYLVDEVHRRRTPTIDQTRPLAELTFDGVRPIARLGDRALLDGILDRARIALAAEQVGVAQRVLDLSVDYAKVRRQFGKPIGSFQAIQHTCADMFVLVESARSAAYYAAWAADHDAPDLALTAATAAAYCADASFRCTGDAIQVHGGIGFTWEHDAHLYFKRARASRALLGAPADHRERVAASLLGG